MKEKEEIEKYALITGASSGIGYELAKVLSENGYNLVLVARSIDKLNILKTELTTKVKLLQLDLFADDCQDILYSFCKKNEIEIDLLVNNAGMGNYNSFAETNEEIIKNMIKLNCLSLAAITRKFLPEMIKRKSGHIVQIASIAGFMPGPLMATYYATKDFVINLSQALSEELKEHGIFVSIICPGPVRTNFQKSAGAKSEKYKKDSSIPTAKDIANYTMKMIRKKNKLCIHGFKHKIVIFLLTRILPRDLVLKLVKNTQIKKRKHYNDI